MEATAQSLPIPQAPTRGLAALSTRQKLFALAGTAALIAIVAASVIWSRQPDYRVLFANLSDKDGGAVIASLSQMNVPYRFAPGGGAILVPEDKVHDVRLKLASQGLPRGGTVGFELLETQKFGVTQFQERLNFQRGLEGELARSIQALAAVQNARVHLALPAQNGFLREQQKPSASVLLALHPGRSLDRGQVAGIVHLVAASVPDLAPRQVSVIDQNGTLLSADGENSANGLDASQLNYMRRIETSFNQRVLDILEPIMGAGNVRAQITADIDFTQSESTAEQYRPNQGGEPATVRSQQVLEAGAKDNAGAAQGIPGALSNQPPQATTAPVNGPAQATQAANANGSAGANGAGNGRREAVTNYEVDKTVRVTRNATGTVKRLSAAVVVNHRRSVDAEGKVSYAPLQPAELENINSLVREAIGFNRERGDSINVVNAPFPEAEQPKEIELPIWQQPENVALAKDLGKQLALVVLALIVIFTLIRPAMKTMARSPAQPALKARVDDTLDLPAPHGGSAGALGAPGTAGALPAPDSNRQADILRHARENPATVANVVRNWIGSEAPGS
ncbi:MAG: flagellar M-ring protein FliF [Burkholderiales bacterium]|nr:flagellar M-ring protein FliF [Burkholderiales bacterium]